MASENCAVCGCDLSLLPTRGVKPVRHQAKIYCGECAGLVLDPDTDRGSEEIEVPDPDEDLKISKEISNTTTPISVSAVRRGAGIEVVEEFKIKATGTKPAQPRERKLDDDEWFKPGSSPKIGAAAPAAVAVQPKKGGTSISKRAAEPAKRPSNRMNAVKPSDRMQTPKPGAKPSGRMAAAPAAKEEDIKKPSRRIDRPGVKPSGRLGKPSPSRARMNAAPAEAPEEVPELVDEEKLDGALPDGEIALDGAEGGDDAPEAIAPAKKKGDSSRRMAAAGTSQKSSRTMKSAKRGSSSAKSGRSERSDREDRNDKSERGRGGKGRGSANNNNTMMIGLGVAGVILLVIIVACLGGGNAATKAKAVNSTPEVLTSASEYAEKGRQLEAAGDRLGAADMFGRAAEAAGSDDAAQKYNMHAYELRKFTTLNMSHGR